jgi:hypothetical protein
MHITVKPLPAKKLFVIGVVEVFDDTVAPRLANGNKYRFNTKMKAEPYD